MAERGNAGVAGQAAPEGAVAPAVDRIMVEEPVDLRGMHVKQVVVMYQRSVGLGGFHDAAKFEARVWADLDADTDPLEAMRQLGRLTKAQVREQALPTLSRYRQNLKALAEKLPPEGRRELLNLLQDMTYEVLLGLPMTEAEMTVDDAESANMVDSD